ncbi:MAG: C40 family peptidase [Candidatus Eremiobacteraeota bacterium]|nr:C40 family peptidase [Candidatus Eremiobacteraeota bacterium]
MILSSVFFLTPVGTTRGLAGIVGYNVAISKVPVLDVRKSPSNSSELVTQILYNERLQTYEKNGEWTRVMIPDQYRTKSGYPGWIRSDKIRRVSRYSYKAPSWIIISTPEAKLYNKLSKNAGSITIYFGTFLQYLGYVKDTRTYPSGKPIYWLKCRSADGEISWVSYNYARIRDGSPFVGKEAPDLVAAAEVYLDTPYLWGGMTPDGVDCSGLTYMAYRYSGYIIPRDADQQFLVGEPVDIGSFATGDMLFYGSGGEVSHVTMYAGNGWMIEASKKKGVIASNTRYGKNYMGARRIIRKH